MENIYVLETREKHIYYNEHGHNGGINIATRFNDKRRDHSINVARSIGYKWWKFDENGKLVEV